MILRILDAIAVFFFGAPRYKRPSKVRTFRARRIWRVTDLRLGVAHPTHSQAGEPLTRRQSTRRIAWLERWTVQSPVSTALQVRMGLTAPGAAWMAHDAANEGTGRAVPDWERILGVQRHGGSS